MNPEHNHVYTSPLVARNATPEMAELFSPYRKVLIWRQLWIALARSQKELGLAITTKQVSQMKRAAKHIDFKKAAKYEKELRHDVMAHIHTFGDAAPAAKPIIHLGATSAFVTDNADLIILREGLGMIRSWLVDVLTKLARFAERYADLPTLGFTHFQPAQLTTVGKRACLWAQDFWMDLERVEHELGQLRFRGTRGATGTQASFLALFNGSAAKVKKLEKLVAQKMGFDDCYAVVGQTYPRKVDAFVINTLASIATSAHKFSNDLRLLAHLREIEEPFEKKQIGSSAMPYKRNPMRSERATALARLILSLATSPPQTAAEQWFERTLDDSANRRVVLPEAFLATDGLLRIIANIVSGLVVNKKVIHARVMAELPFIASENILMEAVKRGGDRQKLHETIRRHAHKAAAQIKDGQPNDLLDRLKADPNFAMLNFAKLLSPERYTGLAKQQSQMFVSRIQHILSSKDRPKVKQSRLDV